MADLTVRDIAVCIQRPGEPLTSASDRLRNWTDMGIIKATGVRNPGTGRKKRYSEGALVRAVFLQALIDATGSPAIAFADSIGEIIEDFYKFSEFGSYDHVLVISRPPTGAKMRYGTTNHKGLGDYIKKSGIDVHTVLNVRRMHDWLVDRGYKDLVKRVTQKKPKS